LTFPKLGCPKIDLGCPKIDLGCPKIHLGCPEISLNCPKIHLGCPKIEPGWPRICKKHTIDTKASILDSTPSPTGSIYVAKRLSPPA
jgi:hypothetical protein